MLGLVEVLLGHEYSFTEKILVDLLSIGFGDEPATSESVMRIDERSMYIHCREFLALFVESRTMGW